MQVEITVTKLEENMLSDGYAQFHHLGVLAEELIQLLTADPQHTAGHHGFNGPMCRQTIKWSWIVADNLAFEREPSDMFSVVYGVILYILEASLYYKGQPPGRVAFAFKLPAFAICDHFALLLAKLSQSLEIYTIITKFFSIVYECTTYLRINCFITFRRQS